MDNFKQAVQLYEKIDQCELFELINPLKLDEYQVIENALDITNHLQSRVKNYNVRPDDFTFIDNLIKKSDEKTNQLPGNIILFFIIRQYCSDLAVIIFDHFF